MGVAISQPIGHDHQMPVMPMGFLSIAENTTRRSRSINVAIVNESMRFVPRSVPSAMILTAIIT